MGTMRPNYTLLPEHLREGFKGYLERGENPGGFISQVLHNDLVHSFACADDVCIACMHDIVKFVYNEMPMASWGSRDIMYRWMTHQQRRLTNE